MNIINIKDIDINKLNLVKIQGSKSQVYVQGDTCYKFVDGLYPDEKYNLLKKFRNMEGIKIDSVILPKDLIMHGNSLVGYTMEYFQNSINLYDYFAHSRFVDSSDILSITAKVSKIMKKAHDSGIILQDVSFDNILIDDNNQIKISDIDGCSFNEIYGPFISKLVYLFFELHDRSNRIDINKNLDRISLTLSMIFTLYHKRLEELSLSEYDELASKISDLRNMRDLIIQLKQRKIIEMPYLDEIITRKDHFNIHRNSQVPKTKELKYNRSLK